MLFKTLNLIVLLLCSLPFFGQVGMKYLGSELYGFNTFYNPTNYYKINASSNVSSSNSIDTYIFAGYSSNKSFLRSGSWHRKEDKLFDKIDYAVHGFYSTENITTVRIRNIGLISKLETSGSKSLLGLGLKVNHHSAHDEEHIGLKGYRIEAGIYYKYRGLLLSSNIQDINSSQFVKLAYVDPNCINYPCDDDIIFGYGANFIPQLNSIVEYGKKIKNKPNTVSIFLMNQYKINGYSWERNQMLNIGLKYQNIKNLFLASYNQVDKVFFTSYKHTFGKNRNFDSGVFFRSSYDDYVSLGLTASYHFMPVIPVIKPTMPW